MTDATFCMRLGDAVRRRGNPVCVGLDPRLSQLPDRMLANRDTSDRSVAAAVLLQFCREVIDVVASLVPVVKPQAAFFEQLGPQGMHALADVIKYARDRQLLVILDGKRNDIGSTASAYADAYLGPQSAWQVDALTVNPYLGEDALLPFVEACSQRQAGIFVLVKTSNPGGGLFQDLVAQHRTVYRHVAEKLFEMSAACVDSTGYGPIGAVVGATYPEQLAELRAVMTSSWILVPGYGSQGGTARDVDPAFDENGAGAIVNNSRGIIFAHEAAPYRERFGASNWQAAVEAATRDMIAALRADTRTARLVSG